MGRRCPPSILSIRIFAAVFPISLIGIWIVVRRGVMY